MQAGRQKAALPLIRRFNEHSERLLKSALFVAFVFITPVRLTEAMFHSGDGPSAKRRRLNDPTPVDVGRAMCIKYHRAESPTLRHKDITRRSNSTTSKILRHRKGLPWT